MSLIVGALISLTLPEIFLFWVRDTQPLSSWHDAVMMGNLTSFYILTLNLVSGYQGSVPPKEEVTEEVPDESEKGEWKSWLKTQYSKN